MIFKVDENNPFFTAENGALYNKDKTVLIKAFGRNTTIADSVKQIEDYAFFRYQFSTISIPDGVETIGNYAFDNCPALNKILIPAKTTQLGEFVFFGCDNLDTIEVAPGNPGYVSGHGILWDLDNSSIVWSTKNVSEEVQIPNGIAVIRRHMFAYKEKDWDTHFTRIRKVILPGSVTKIEFGAFDFLPSLEEVVIPASVTEIEEPQFVSGWEMQWYYRDGELSYPVLYVESGSYAEEYAIKNNIQFVIYSDSFAAQRTEVISSCAVRFEDIR